MNFIVTATVECAHVGCSAQHEIELLTELTTVGASADMFLAPGVPCLAVRAMTLRDADWRLVSVAGAQAKPYCPDHLPGGKVEKVTR